MSPVELVDVFDVSKQSTDLLGTDRQVALVDDVSQVVLQEERVKDVIENHNQKVQIQSHSQLERRSVSINEVIKFFLSSCHVSVCPAGGRLTSL